MMMAMMGEKMEIIELSNDVLHGKMSTCPICIQGTSQELCEAMMNTDKKMVSILLGQQVDFKIPKSLAAGDKYCEIIISKK
jgi:hypothetical protein